MLLVLVHQWANVLKAASRSESRFSKQHVKRSRWSCSLTNQPTNSLTKWCC